MTATVVNPERRLHEISLILRDLLKVIKVVSMYPEGNPLPQSLKRSFAERLVTLVEDYGDIRIQVNKTDLRYENETAYTDTSKDEGLAALFFEVGITSFTFKEGIDVPEIYRILDVIKVYQNSHDKSQDLANKFWEASVSRFAFTTLEDIALAEYTGEFIVQEMHTGHGSSGVIRTQMSSDTVEDYNAIFNPNITDRFKIIEDQSGGVHRGRLSDDPSPVNASAGMPSATGTAGSVLADSGLDESLFKAAEAAEAMGFENVESGERGPIPNTALILNDEFKLSGEQEQEIAGILAEDAQFDTFESTVELLKEMLHQEAQMDDFYETVTICEKVLHEFVGSGRLNEAGHMLQYFVSLEDQIRAKKPLWAERLRDARLTAGSRDRLRLLSQALNRSQDLGAADMRRYLDNFGWETLSAVTDMLGDIEQQTHREALCDYLAVRGRENLAVVAKGMYDKRWFVVRNSITILAKTGDSKALGYLGKAVKHEDKRVRMELVTALRESPSDEALTILKELVRDSDPEIGRSAVDAIVVRHGQAAFDIVTEIINDDSFLTLSQEEQKALLRAFSISGGQHAVEYLHQLIARIDLFHDPILTFFRKAAFEALTENRSEKAEQLLVKLGGSLRPDIRHQAAAALRRRRDIIYGGSDGTARK
jgi:hypothetical protein